MDSALFLIPTPVPEGGNIRVSVNTFGNEFHDYEGAFWIYDRNNDANTWENQVLTRPSEDSEWLFEDFLIDTLAERGFVPKVNVIRALILDSEGDTVETQTFFVGLNGEGNTVNHKMPVIHIYVDSLDAFGPEGFYGPGDGLLLPAGFEGAQDGLMLLIPPDVTEEFVWNYQLKWSDQRVKQLVSLDRLEKPCHAQVVGHLDNSIILKQNLGVRLAGQASLSFYNKSMRLVARSDYGPNRIETDIFGQPEQLKSLRLRSGGSGQGYGLGVNEIALRMMDGMRLGESRVTPAIVYLNGSYWSMTFVQERADHHLAGRYHGINPDQIDIFDLTGYFGTFNLSLLTDSLQILDSTVFGSIPFEVPEESFLHGISEEDNDRLLLFKVREGSKGDFEQRCEILFRLHHDTLSTSYFTVLDSILDINSWLRYIAFVDFICATDHINNNMLIVNDKVNKPYPLAKDFDSAFNNGYFESDVNFWELLYDPEYMSYNFGLYIIKDLILSDSVSVQWFLRVYQDLLNTQLMPEKTLSTVDNIYSEAFFSEIDRHFHSWGGQPNGGFFTAPDYANRVVAIKEFLQERPDHVWSILADVWLPEQDFDIDDRNTVTIIMDSIPEGIASVRLNSLNIDTSWSGMYYPVPSVHASFKIKPEYMHLYELEWLEYPDSSLNLVLNPETNIILTPVLRSKGDSSLIHYWHFNGLESGELSAVMADSSATGVGHITYSGEGSGYMDRVNEGSLLNIRRNETAGQGLRVRNPSDTRALVLNMPTTGFKDIVFSYVVKRTNNGAQENIVQYLLSPDSNWITLPGVIQVTPEHVLHTFNLSDVNGAADNRDFGMRILFLGANAAAFEGNNRFDNIALTGKPTDCPPLTLAHLFHFNDLPSGASDEVLSDISLTPIPAIIRYEGDGEGFIDNVNDGSFVNGQMGQPAGLGLRVRNPSDTRDLVIDIPTDNLFDVYVSYAVKRTTNGAKYNIVSCRTGPTQNWVVVSDTIEVGEEYARISIDLSQIAGTANNPDLQLRVSFLGEETVGTLGNNRFDNLAIHGRQLMVELTQETACSGATFEFNGQDVVVPGEYHYILPNEMGCDSIARMLILQSQTQYTHISDTSCGPYAFNGNIITGTGLYSDTLTSVHGCDSIIELDLQVISPSDTVLYVSGCGSCVYGDTSFTTSTLLVETYTGFWGCDSTVIVNVVVHNGTSSVLNVSSCGSYEINGLILDTSGIYLQTSQNIHGCDSVIVINFERLELNAATIQAGNVLISENTDADTYQWLDCNNDLLPITSADEYYFVPQESGSYAITLFYDTCEVTSECFDFQPTGLDDLSDGQGIRIAPNPSNGSFRLFLSDVNPTEVIQLQVFNSKGQLVLFSVHRTQPITAHDYMFLDIELDHPTSGLYVLTISHNNQLSSKKVLVR